MEPFIPKGASVFNRFFRDDLANAFFGGALVLLILTYLTSISHSLLYPTRSLRKRAIDRYIIFSRVSSFRGVVRLISGIEWPHRLFSIAPFQGSHSFDTNSEETDKIPQVRRKYSKLAVPCGIRILLLAAEFAAIYAGTSVNRFATTEEGFDVAITAVSAALDTTSFNTTGCDDYLVPARGQEQAGELLKCVFRTSEETTPFVPSDKNKSIALIFTPSQNSLIFELRSTEYRINRVQLQVVLNTINGESFEFSPVRPDLDLDRSTTIFDSVIDGLLNELQHPRDGVWSVGQSSDDFSIAYSQDIPIEQTTITDQLVRQLRALPLSMNSTGPPWLFIDGRYEQRDDLRIAIIALNRVAHGILLAMTVVLAFFHALVQRFFPSFSEVAYAALKGTIGDTPGAGPGATRFVTTDEDRGDMLLRLQRFSDGTIGHIGFRPSKPSQVPVDTLDGCRIVL